MIRLRRRPLFAGLILLAAIVGGVLWLIHNASAMPIVRRTSIALPFPEGAPRRPLTVALMTDTHLSGPDNSPERMARIVAQINALHPDLILLGGDYMGDDKGGAVYDAQASIAPFRQLHAPLGVVAVLGNHDSHSKKNPTSLKAAAWHDAFTRIGIPLLQNGAIRRGPIVVGGVKDIYTRKVDIAGTLRTMDRLGGAPIFLSHGPDIFPALPDKPILMLVGHTHCGQMALPFFGPVYTPSRFGLRYACGEYRDGLKRMIVAAGVGTSGLPFRMFAPPDIWLITIRPL